MTIDEVKQLIETGLPNANVSVDGDGSHFGATVICDDFVDKSLLQQQKLVMATVNKQIISGELHALSIKSYTPEQWGKNNA